jgi:hypothetical protein
MRVSVNGHLGCTYLLATVDNVVMNMNINYLNQCFQLSFLCSQKLPCDDSMFNSFFMFNSFEDPLQHFTQWLQHFTLPPATHKSSDFFTSLPSFVIFCLFGEVLFCFVL